MLRYRRAAQAADVVHFQWLALPQVDRFLLPDRPLVLTAHDVLAREPRHFAALSGLGVIMQEFGEDKLALQAFRRALAVNPHLPKIPDFVKTLTEKVEGRDI